MDQHIIDQFIARQQKGRLAHAYLLVGDRQDYLYDMAFEITKALNCQHQPYHQGCECSSCRKLITGNHPDFFMIEKPEDKTEILISQITVRENQPYRPLLPWLSVKTLEAQVRVVIVKEAHLMSQESANAFLKTLEEPPAKTLFLLTTTAVIDILPTIQSRCQQILLNENIKQQQLSHWVDQFILVRIDEKQIKSIVENKQDVQCLIETILMFYRDMLMLKAGVEKISLIFKEHGSAIERLSLKHTQEDVLMIIEQATKTMRSLQEGLNVKVALVLLKELMDDIMYR